MYTCKPTHAPITLNNWPCEQLPLRIARKTVSFVPGPGCGRPTQASPSNPGHHSVGTVDFANDERDELPFVLQRPVPPDSAVDSHDVNCVNVNVNDFQIIAGMEAWNRNCRISCRHGFLEYCTLREKSQGSAAKHIESNKAISPATSGDGTLRICDGL